MKFSSNDYLPADKYGAKKIFSNLSPKGYQPAQLKQDPYANKEAYQVEPDNAEAEQDLQQQKQMQGTSSSQPQNLANRPNSVDSYSKNKENFNNSINKLFFNSPRYKKIFSPDLNGDASKPPTSQPPMQKAGENQFGHTLHNEKSSSLLKTFNKESQLASQQAKGNATEQSSKKRTDSKNSQPPPEGAHNVNQKYHDYKQIISKNINLLDSEKAPSGANGTSNGANPTNGNASTAGNGNNRLSFNYAGASSGSEPKQ